jgi:CheY-like chemotaxis protein
MNVPDRRLSVFVLEDEALIRMMTVEMVEELGHFVVAEAGSISEALSLAETADFDLALLDVNIRGHVSFDVAAIIEQRRLPMLFVSGYNATGLPPPFDQHLLLQKPFDIHALKKAIDRVLT